MDLEHFRKVLLGKERELATGIARLAEEARNSRSAEVEDPIDEVTSDEAQSTALEEGSTLSETLAQVKAALQRLDRGEYGRCIDCGREIEDARLRAVPWTPYCLEDQQKHDTCTAVSGAS